MSKSSFTSIRPDLDRQGIGDGRTTLFSLELSSGSTRSKSTSGGAFLFFIEPFETLFDPKLELDLPNEFDTPPSSSAASVESSETRDFKLRTGKSNGFSPILELLLICSSTELLSGATTNIGSFLRY